MFETEFSGVMSDSPALDDQVINTETTDEVVEPALDNQASGQADIQDGSQVEETVPYSRLVDVNTKYHDQVEINKKLIQLLENTNKTQPEVQQGSEDDFIDQIVKRTVGDDTFVEADKFSAALREIVKTIQQQTQQTTTQSERERYIQDQKQTYIAQYPDYTENHERVMQEAQNDPAVAKFIMESKNPVETMYKYGKFLRGETLTPATPSTTVKSVIPPAPKAKPPVTLNQVKGGSIGKVEEPTSAEDIFRSRFG